MDQELIFEKTVAGEEAVRERTRVVQRNSRMVLVQVDGSVTVADLISKIGNRVLVEKALQDLLEGGYIQPAAGQPADGGRTKKRAARVQLSADEQMSQFSAFGRSQFPLSKGLPSSASQMPMSGLSLGGPTLIGDYPQQGRHSVAPDQEAAAAPSMVAERRIPGDWDARRYRKPRWGLRILLGLSALLVLGIAVVLLYPYSNYQPAIEAALGRSLGGPVKVGSVGLAFAPMPVLRVKNLSIGDGGISVRQLSIAKPWQLLGSGRHLLSAATVDGLKVSVDSLPQLAYLAQSMDRADGPFAVERIAFVHTIVTAGSLSFTELQGELALQPGDFGLSLLSDDSRLSLRLSRFGNGLGVEMEALGWKPLGGGFPFDSLRLKGVLRDGGLALDSFDANLYGGRFAGQAQLTIAADGALAGAGKVTVDHLRLDRLAADVPDLGLSGDLAGSLSFRFSGADWQSLAVEGNGQARVGRGVMKGLDLAEAVRRGRGLPVQGGETSFESASADLNFAPRSWKLQHLQIDAGLMNADGNLTVNGQQVDGLMNVSLGRGSLRSNDAVSVSGVLGRMEARNAR